ncbi:unnamed protein product [Macrosiphum euphorbiae]|nr:unnamed protein product [Macrosiphum euphorbiae]
MRSDIGERLKDFSVEKSDAQIIRQSMVNINVDISKYELTYGCIPTSFVPEMQVVITKYIEDRYSKTPVLVDGELEFFCMTYWRYFSSDLIEYCAKTPRKLSKMVMGDIVKKLLMCKRILPTNTSKIIEKMKDVFLPKLLCAVNVEDEDHVTVGSLCILKMLLTTFLTMYKLPKTTISFINGIFMKLKIEHKMTGNTFNKVVKAQDLVLWWFIETCNFHRIGILAGNLPSSVFVNILKSPTCDKSSQISVFAKTDIFEVFKFYFSKSSDVSSELCIAVDNFFMLIVVWFSNYMCNTGLLSVQSSGKFKQVILPQFLKSFNKHVVEQYEHTIIAANYSARIKNKFAEAVCKNVSRLSKAEGNIERPKKISFEQSVLAL